MVFGTMKKKKKKKKKREDENTIHTPIGVIFKFW